MKKGCLIVALYHCFKWRQVRKQTKDEERKKSLSDDDNNKSTGGDEMMFSIRRDGGRKCGRAGWGGWGGPVITRRVKQEHQRESRGRLWPPGCQWSHNDAGLNGPIRNSEPFNQNVVQIKFGKTRDWRLDSSFKPPHTRHSLWWCHSPADLCVGQC